MTLKSDSSDHPTAGASAPRHDTRARMIEAAIEVFGSCGYDGASTRQLADKAGVNQAAIPYHFGGKRELYVAAAQAIADYLRVRMDPLIGLLRDPGGADRIEAAVTGFFHLLVGNEEPEAWTTFFVRCEREADDAFRLIHLQAVAPFQSALIAAVAAARGLPPSDEDLKLRVVIVLGAISNVRTLRNVMLSSLGWDRFTDERKSKLETAVRRLVRAELLDLSSALVANALLPLCSLAEAEPSSSA